MTTKNPSYYRLVIFSTAIVLLTVIEAIGQPVIHAKIDSLHQLLRTNGQNYEVLYFLAHEYIDYNNEEAYRYIKPCYQLALKSGDSLKIVKSGLRVAAVLRRLEKNDSTLVMYHYLIPIARRNQFKEELTYMTNGAGLVLSFQASYTQALAFFLESLSLRQERARLDEVSIVLNNIGIVYYKMKSYAKAREFLQQSVVLKDSIHDSYDLDLAYMNIALCNAYLKEYDKAEQYIKKGFGACGVKCSDDIKSLGYFGLGVVQLGKQKYSEALDHFKAAYKVASENGDNRLQADNLVYLGKVNGLQGNRQQAMEYLEEAARLAKAFGYHELLLTAYEELIRLSEFDIEKLSYYQRHYIEEREKIYNAELIEGLSKLEAEFLEKENLARIEHQKSLIELNERLISKQKSITIVTGAVFLLILGLTFILYKDNRLKKGMHDMLEKRVHERSLELKISIDELAMSNHENLLRANKSREEVMDYVESIKKICSEIQVSQSEVDVEDYVSMISTTVDQLIIEVDGNLKNTVKTLN